MVIRLGLRAPWAVGMGLGGCVALAGCRTEADQACVSAFESAQAVVLAVDGKRLDSLDTSIGAVDAAIQTCEAAGRSSEVQELQKAKSNLSSHRDVVFRNEEMKRARTERSPKEIEQLAQSGDPLCPRGQAYVHGKSGKRIRCTGPQPAQMDWLEARAYFKRRGYAITENAEATRLRLAYGAETLVFDYARPDSDEAAACITLYPSPDRSWQESTSRITGVSPGRIKSGRPLRMGRVSRPLRVEDDPNRVIVWLGDCGQGQSLESP